MQALRKGVIARIGWRLPYRAERDPSLRPKRDRSGGFAEDIARRDAFPL